MSDSNANLGIAFEIRGSIVIATILDSQAVEPGGVEQFGDSMVAYMEENPEANLLLSFGQVTYMSSSAVTQLIRIKETCDRLGVKMALFGLREDIMRIFEITNLVEHLHAMPETDEEQACKRFRRLIQIEADDAEWNDS